MNSNVLRIVVSVLLLACCVNASAHHSHASLNTDDIRRFEGVVTKYSWRAPHVYIQANVMGEDGEVREYKVEALNPPAMTALGWKKDSFEPGDRIIWEGAHDKDVNRPYAGINWAELEDGTRLHANPTDYRKAQAALAAALAERRRRSCACRSDSLTACGRRGPRGRWPGGPGLRTRLRPPRRARRGACPGSPPPSPREACASARRRSCAGRRCHATAPRPRAPSRRSRTGGSRQEGRRRRACAKRRSCRR